MPICLNKSLLVRPASALILFVFSGTLLAVNHERERLLDESEYRSDLEEVVVVGTEPEWRKKQDQEWRPPKFELPELTNKGRIQWVPEYTKDERDNYDGVRDRTGEKPEFKIFEWKF